MATTIAIITDAHGSFPALEAALAAIAESGCDAIYHTGDAIGIGPHSPEVLDRLRSTPNLHLIMGNHDEWYVFGVADPAAYGLPESAYRHLQWVHDQLGPSLRPTVATWPFRLSARVHGRSILFTHYPRRPDGQGFVSIMPRPTVADLDHLFAGEDADLIFYGHHHPASDIQGRARYVNVGSLACHPEPVARFALLDVADTGAYELEHRHVPYDQALFFRDLEERQVAEGAFIRRAFFERPD